MNHKNKPSASSYRMMAAAAKLSLAASAGCFVISGIGSILNQFVPDVICAEGLAVVACFYFIIGAFDLIRVRLWRSRSQITESH